jgi:hypothetical protein
MRTDVANDSRPQPRTVYSSVSILTATERCPKPEAEFRYEASRGVKFEIASDPLLRFFYSVKLFRKKK